MKYKKGDIVRLHKYYYIYTRNMRYQNDLNKLKNKYEIIDNIEYFWKCVNVKNPLDFITIHERGLYLCPIEIRKSKIKNILK